MVFIGLGITESIVAPTKTYKTVLHTSTVPNCFTSTVRLSSELTVVLMDMAAGQPAAWRRLCSTEQCALMCFTGLTADSDEGMDNAACHFVVEKKRVWFLDRGREDYSDLFKHAFVFVTL